VICSIYSEVQIDEEKRRNKTNFSNMRKETRFYLLSLHISEIRYERKFHAEGKSENHEKGCKKFIASFPAILNYAKKEHEPSE
jgi:hypothetical protein